MGHVEVIDENSDRDGWTITFKSPNIDTVNKVLKAKNITTGEDYDIVSFDNAGAILSGITPPSPTDILAVSYDYYVKVGEYVRMECRF